MFKKILLVGFGPHSERIYAPILHELEDCKRLKVTCVLELAENIEATKVKATDLGLTPDVIAIQKTKNGELTQDLKIFLDDLQNKYLFDGVIIATEPTQHRQYILWALENHLHILVDKPVTTYDNVSNDIFLAKKIEDDFRLFSSKYVDRSKAFIVNAQRRYHNGFRFVLEKISEISERFQIPVTSSQSMHSDGQWRFPDEIENQTYHPYNSGYGKVSHSGYHIIDMVNEFIKAGTVTGKEADEYEYFTKFVSPDGILKQMQFKNYEQIFSKDNNQINDKFATVDVDSFSKYGEIDSHTTITPKLHGINIGNYTISLMHNTFSRRNWINPGKDLYKGNGRVKHEYHNIVQGPLQTIQIHSYQSNDKHNINTKDDYSFGGNNHFDICIFRNNAVTGDDKPFELVSIDNLGNYDSSRLVTETTKKTVVFEFIDIMFGIKVPNDSYSHFLTHADSVRMMSMIYMSAHQSGKIVSTYKYES